MKYFILLLLLISACNSKSPLQSNSNTVNQATFFNEIYDNFNKRNIDFVINNMTGDVKWANGMDGGFVYGHDGVREYWTRQFKLVSSNVTPVEVKQINGKVIITVHQVVHDLQGKLLADETVRHIFTMHDDKIAGFEIEK